MQVNNHYATVLIFSILLVGIASYINHTNASSQEISLETTATPTGILTSTPTATPPASFSEPILFTPLIFLQKITDNPELEFETVLYCDIQPIIIPDNQVTGVSSTISIDEPRFIADLDVRVNITHSWVGDLKITLNHLESGKSTNIIDRPGIPLSTFGCENDNIVTILDDEITLNVENKCANFPAAISGIYTPNETLESFTGIPLSGSWNLSISDNNPSDDGRLNDWCLAAKISEFPVSPPPPPVIPDLPPQAFISEISGKTQLLPLDCESRSAVDWAGYFGITIDELTFFNQIPKSDNPDTGFVGNVFGSWGQIPPDPYGVHAEPIANLLRNYGLNAYAHRPLSWETLRSEIAAGKPVIVWITGAVENGIPVFYSPTDGQITVVAPYEHTVVVTGYTESSVYFLNGSQIYSKTVEHFLDSWSVLGNMAVTSNP